MIIKNLENLRSETAQRLGNVSSNSDVSSILREHNRKENELYRQLSNARENKKCLKNT